jgi:ribonuclease P protein component
MIAKIFRFHGHNSVRNVYRRGSVVRNSLGSLHTYADERTRQPRVAVVVSRKVSKSAVVRNRIRRRVYEIIRTGMPDLKHPAQMVFTVYQVDAATMPAEDLRSQVLDLLHQSALR